MTNDSTPAPETPRKGARSSSGERSSCSGGSARFLCRSWLPRLVNNVGSNSGGNLMKSNDEDWKKTFEMNLFQAIRMTRMVSHRT